MGYLYVRLVLFGQLPIPIGSMYGILTYIYHENQPNLGKYTLHGSYGIERLQIIDVSFSTS